MSSLARLTGLLELQCLCASIGSEEQAAVGAEKLPKPRHLDLDVETVQLS